VRRALMSDRTCHGIQQTMNAPRMMVMVRRALRVRWLLRVSCCSRFLSASHIIHIHTLSSLARVSTRAH